MHTSVSIREIQDQARLLFTLLDAVDCDGRMPAALSDRWREARARVSRTQDYRAEGVVFWDLLTEIEASQALSGSWIEQRWRMLGERLGVAV